MKILLSIKPQYVLEIKKGTKKYEYRKNIFKKDVDKVIIYCTQPVGKIVAEFEINEIINDSPKEVWNKTALSSGISKDKYEEYFKNSKQCYAIGISKLVEYSNPIDPYLVDKEFCAPQSYQYISEEKYKMLYALKEYEIVLAKA